MPKSTASKVRWLIVTHSNGVSRYAHEDENEKIFGWVDDISKARRFLQPETAERAIDYHGIDYDQLIEIELVGNKPEPTGNTKESTLSNIDVNDSKLVCKWFNAHGGEPVWMSECGDEQFFVNRSLESRITKRICRGCNRRVYLHESDTEWG